MTPPRVMAPLLALIVRVPLSATLRLTTCAVLPLFRISPPRLMALPASVKALAPELKEMRFNARPAMSLFRLVMLEAPNVSDTPFAGARPPTQLVPTLQRADPGVALQRAEMSPGKPMTSFEFTLS